MTDTPNSQDTTMPPTAGWTVTSPSGHPHTWYQHGFQGVTDSASAMELFEKRPRKRQALLKQGWAASPGNGPDLHTATQGQRISA